jgi:phospholipid/cholesterol/gamma-HCH transport system permease protein
MVSGLGRLVVAFLAFIGDEVMLLAASFSFIVRGRTGAHRTILQMSIAGTDSLPIASATLFLVGMAWAWQTATLTVQFGLTNYYGGGTAVAVARELGPALCGVVVAARVGSAYAAELGTMAVTEQVDALRALAISPTYYLVVPRLIACTLMLPILTIVADASGVIGAYALSGHFGIARGEFFNSIQQWLGWSDVGGGLIKSLVFGVIIAMVGCRQGLRTTGGAAGVGTATTSAVVLSIVLIYAANLLLTGALWG